MSSPYRQAILDRLSSPERLDEAIHVIRPRWWMALAVTLLLVASALIWGFTGSIDMRTTTSGALVTPNSITEVLSPVDGYVVSTADEDSAVSAGEVIARVRPEDAAVGAPDVEVHAPTAGRLFESEARVGEFVRRGQAVSRVESAAAARGRGLMAITYVSPSQASSLHPGMAVRITPVTVASATYGFLKGAVRSVGTIPESDSGILAAVQDPKLAREAIAGSEGLPIEVKVSLDVAPTPSGYGWSTGSGPPFALADGTVATLEITTGTRKPLDFLIGS